MSPPEAPPTSPPRVPPVSPPVPQPTAPPQTSPMSPPRMPPTSPPRTPPVSPPKLPPAAPPKRVPPVFPPTAPPRAPPVPLPRSPPPPPPSLLGTCPRRIGPQLRICGSILSIIDRIIGIGRVQPCCLILRNLSNADALACLCESVRAPRGSLPPNISTLFRNCGGSIPPGFTCP
ncbi:proline-rich extensin-like protein EPR1 [Raphanus sativus]|nr:proline-rich extensin-like protein EPR1 [Raphanus sativus]KAJ4899745.1 proline-rich extensin-like protein EPR1 [Raphanus sativus]